MGFAVLHWYQIIKKSRLAATGWHGLWRQKSWPLFNFRPGQVCDKSRCRMHRRPVHCTPGFRCGIKFSVNAGFLSLRHNLPLSLLSLSFICMATRWRMLSSSSITTFSFFLCCINGQELFEDWKHICIYTCFQSYQNVFCRCDHSPSSVRFWVDTYTSSFMLLVVFDSTSITYEAF